MNLVPEIRGRLVYEFTFRHYSVKAPAALGRGIVGASAVGTSVPTLEHCKVHGVKIGKGLGLSRSREHIHIR